VADFSGGNGRLTTIDFSSNLIFWNPIDFNGPDGSVNPWRIHALN